ncbi:MAG: cysteine desulfurase [Pirellulales bacterium]|nr:cysteine desulfurase [Pirellulales bacterium]
MSATDTRSALDPTRLRPDFPILSMVLPGGAPLVYLDNAATTQRPRAVIDSLVTTYEQHYANVHRGIHWLSDQSTDRYEETREKVRRFINAPHREEIIFTDGTTEGINLVARSWCDANLKPGDEILLTELEHHSNIVPWQQAAARTGAVVRFAPVTDEGLIDLDAFDKLLSERTRIVAVASVSNVLGTINPIADLVARAHAAGALFLVDAAQSVPHEKTDVVAWGADFVAFSGHKMMGPSGVGILWGRRELLEAMPPFLGGGSMIRRVTTSGFEPADLPAKFEAGTPPIVPAIGLGAAIDYLEQVGMQAIHEHERLLTERAHEVLATVGGVKIYGPDPSHKAGIVSFTMQGVHAHDIAQLLDRKGIAVRAGHHCAMPLHKKIGANATARASFYLYNTLEEVEQLAAGLIAAQKTLRRR